MTSGDVFVLTNKLVLEGVLVLAAKVLTLFATTLFAIKFPFSKAFLTPQKAF